MKRRNLLLGLGTAASVGSGVIGTGAISQITADREFNLSIVEDQSAYLGIKSSTRSDLVTATGPPNGIGVIQIDLTEFNDLADGGGFNKGATTELTDPVDESGSALFSVQNQSDRKIEFVAATVGDTDDLQETHDLLSQMKRSRHRRMIRSRLNSSMLKRVRGRRSIKIIPVNLNRVDLESESVSV